jgi:3-oxosteroid 1-dehydrogenase
MSDETTFDVIVVGSGAGLVGAYTAAARGLRTLVIEKTAYLGGTTSLSGAGIWLPGNAAQARAGQEDGPDAARPYLDEIVGDDAPVELREAFLQGGPRMIDRLEQNHWFQHFQWRGVPDYFEGRPGASVVGRTIFPPDLPRSALGNLATHIRPPMWTERWGVPLEPTMVGGQALIGRLLLALMETGNGEVRLDTALESLVVEDGRVVGVVAVSEGERVTLRAAKGVLLAAGGFERDPELRERHQPGLGTDHTQGVEGNTGDALKAGVAVGAATALLDESWFAPGLVVPETRPVFYTTVWSGIWVNDEGKRYLNERLPYDRAGHEMLRAEREAGGGHLPTHWIFDRRQLDNERAFAGLPVAPEVPGWFDEERFLEAGVLVKADTLEELAELIGVPAGELGKTVEQWNGYVRAGVDEQFHRGESPWDKTITHLAGEHTDGPNPVIGLLDRAPYYAMKIVLSDLGTKGGLVTDGSARVLRPDGSIIEGLYASGNTMAPATGRIYPGAGGPVGSSMVFSYLAAEAIAES